VVERLPVIEVMQVVIVDRCEPGQDHRTAFERSSLLGVTKQLARIQ
jgi:hypothetical protein